MRIIDMRPEITPWKDGTDRKVGKWRFRDKYVSMGGYIREIWHYETKMIEFVGHVREQRRVDHERDEIYEDVIEWVAIPLTVGHGSVSDQGGVNQLLSVTGRWGHGGHTLYQSYGYYMARDERGGGPRIINMMTDEVEVD